jgi:hypothetical protein
MAVSHSQSPTKDDPVPEELANSPRGQHIRFDGQLFLAVICLE